MLLILRNLPANIRYPEIKTFIQSKCGVKELILDNLVPEGDGMKVTVGVAEESDAAILVRKINGVYYNGYQLRVEDSRKKAALEQSYISTNNIINSQYGNQFQRHTPYQNVSNYRPPEQNVVQQPTGFTNFNMAMGAMPYYNYLQGQNPSASDYGVQSMPFGTPNMFQYGNMSMPPMPPNNWAAGGNNGSQQDSRWSGFSPAVAGQSQGAHSTEAVQSGRKERFDSDFSSRKDRKSFGNDHSERVVQWRDDRNSSQRSDRNSIQRSDRNSTQRSDRNSTQRSDRNSTQWPDRNSNQWPDRNSTQWSDRNASQYSDRGSQRFENSENKYSYEHKYKDNSYNSEDGYSNVYGSHVTGEKLSRNLARKRPQKFQGRDEFAPNEQCRPGARVSRETSRKRPRKEYKELDRPYVKKVKPNADRELQMLRNNTWRGQACCLLVKDIVTAKALLLENRHVTALKAAVRKRIDDALGNEMFLQQDSIVELYRKAYHRKHDAKFLEEIVKNVDDAAVVKLNEGLDDSEKVAKKQQKALEIAAARKTRKSRKKEEALAGSSVAPVKTSEPVIQSAEETLTMKFPLLKTEFKAPAPTDPLPKYPEGDKKMYNQHKRARKEEDVEDYMPQLSPVLQKVLKEEVQVLVGMFTDQFISPEAVADMVIPVDVRVTEEFRKIITLHTIKRLLNVTTSLVVRVFGNPRPPKKEELSNFLRAYDVISLKKSDRVPLYIASCGTYDGYDRLLALQTTVLGDNTVSFKAMHTSGVPDKKEERKKKIVAQTKYIKRVFREYEQRIADIGDLGLKVSLEDDDVIISDVVNEVFELSDNDVTIKSDADAEGQTDTADDDGDGNKDTPASVDVPVKDDTASNQISDEVCTATDEVLGKSNEVGGKTDEVAGKIDDDGGKTDEAGNKTGEDSGKTDEVGDKINDGAKTDEAGPNTNDDGAKTNGVDAKSDEAAVKSDDVIVKKDENGVKTNNVGAKHDDVSAKTVEAGIETNEGAKSDVDGVVSKVADVNDEGGFDCVLDDDLEDY